MAVDQASILALALRAVAYRILLLLTMAASASLFSWAMWSGEWIRLAIAATFTVLVFLPVLLKGERNGKDD